MRTLKKSKVLKITESLTNLKSSKNLTGNSKTEQKDKSENWIREH